MNGYEQDSSHMAMEAAVFRRLVDHLRMRDDIPNVQLMGEAGFCRNCLADWLVEASVEFPNPLTREEARDIIYGEPYVNWKKRQGEASSDQLARMEASVAENARRLKDQRSQSLDQQLDQSFPASDPPGITRPR